MSLLHFLNPGFELQIVFSAEDASMEIQMLAFWNLLGDSRALYFGIKLVSNLLRE